jgi:hypothetical protein
MPSVQYKYYELVTQVYLGTEGVLLERNTSFKHKWKIRQIKKPIAVLELPAI